MANLFFTVYGFKEKMLVSRDENFFFKVPKLDILTGRLWFLQYSVVFVKEIQNEVSACFYETLLIVKFLSVTLFIELVPAF